MIDKYRQYSHTSHGLEGDMDRLASYLLEDEARDWWEEVGRRLSDVVVDAMSLDEF